jgi:RNA polymerase sigma-70 factor (ECF subfamily)
VPRDRADWFAIAAQIEAGDAAALLRLTGLVSSLLMRVGAYRTDASHQDLVQEITVALLDGVRRGAIHEPSKFVGYAWTTTRNRWLNLLRSRERSEARPSDRPLEELGPDDPALEAQRHEIDPGTRLDLERAFERLPGPERAAIAAIYLEGRSYEEAAKELGVPLGTLKRRQWNGLKLLRQCMQVDGSFS